MIDWDNIDNNSIIDMYVNKKMTLVEIGKEAGVNASTVGLLLKKNNVKMRRAIKRYTDIKGVRSGKLVAKEYKGIINGTSHWLCDCDCGGQHVVSAKQLIRKDKKKTVSCGCMNYLGLSGKNNPMYGVRGKDHPTYVGPKILLAHKLAANAKRRSTKKNQTPELTEIEKNRILFIYEVCGTMADYHVDHIQPISKGGLHHPDNLQILSAELNLQKSDKYPLTDEEQELYKGVTI